VLAPMLVLELALVLAACVPVAGGGLPGGDLPGSEWTGSGPTAPGPTSSAAQPSREPDEDAYLTFLRGQQPPIAEFEAYTDAELIAVGKDICGLVTQGASPDDILQAWLDTGASPTDEAIVALFTAAEYTYCPDTIDLENWYSSPVWRKRVFLTFVADGAGDFSMTDPAAAIAAAEAICDLLALGRTPDDIVGYLHEGRGIGMVPDRDGALALIAASQWALCPTPVER